MHRALVAIIFMFILLFATSGFAFDHTYTQLNMILKEYVRDGKVNYAGLTKEKDLLKSAVREIEAVSESDLKAFVHPQKLAFWTNAYNILTLKVIVENYPINGNNSLYPFNSIRQIEGAFTSTYLTIGKTRMNLHMILHNFIRPLGEPRLIFCINLGALGGAAVRSEAYDPLKIESQIAEQTKNFITDPARVKVNPDAELIQLSSLFQIYGKDFIGKYYNLGRYPHHSKEECAVINLVGTEFNADQKSVLEKELFTIQYFPFDWALNEITS